MLAAPGRHRVAARSRIPARSRGVRSAVRLAALEAFPGRGCLGADLVVVVRAGDEAEVVVGLLPTQDGDGLDDLSHLAAITQRARAGQRAHGAPVAERDQG